MAQESIYNDARYRSSGTPSNFVWDLRDTVCGHDLSVVRCLQVSLPNSMFTIEQDNRHIYTRRAGLTSVTPLEIGFYSGPEFAAHLTQRLGPLAIQAEYIAISNSIRIFSTAPFEILTDAELTTFAPNEVRNSSWPGTMTDPLSCNDVLRHPRGLW